MLSKAIIYREEDKKNSYLFCKKGAPPHWRISNFPKNFNYLIYFVLAENFI